MTHLYTRASECALLALQAMCTEPDRTWKVPQICAQAEIPEQFTRKVLTVLVEAEILDSLRGPRGGFSLAREPGDISLLEVVQAVDEGPRLEVCILGFSECDEKNPCALHQLWAPIKFAAREMLQERTLLDLEGPIKKRSRRSR